MYKYKVGDKVKAKMFYSYPPIIVEEGTICTIKGVIYSHGERRYILDGCSSCIDPITGLENGWGLSSTYWELIDISDFEYLDINYFFKLFASEIIK